ncbi:MAG: MFS transporter [Candidatus Omnitrophica bacterium]|nr:MFS transporter [Candidatus Omnitrophota bacterium]
MSTLDSRGFRALWVTEFLDAFHDNALKFAIFLLILFSSWPKPFGSYSLLAAGAAFILPFLIFSSFAGAFADRFSKKKMIVAVKVLEVGLAFLSLAAFKLERLDLLIAILFLMGLKSTFFSPAKYGLLPTILHEDDLSLGNGRIMLAGYVAILLGQALGIALPDLAANGWVQKTPYIFLAAACAGLAASLFIEQDRPVVLSGGKARNSWRELVGGVVAVRADKALFQAAAGLMVLGFLTGIFELNVLFFARDQVGPFPQLLGMLLVALAFGLALGGVLSGWVSDQKIELGLVPLGAVGLSVFAFFLGFARHDVVGLAATLFGLGVSVGFYSVPLNAFLQYRAPLEARARVIAVSNILIFASMLAGFCVFMALHYWYGVSPRSLMQLCGVLVVLATIYTVRVLPYPFIRLCVWILTHTVYRLRVINKEVLPHAGGALVVANHLSFVDVLFLIVSTSRKVRFVASRGTYNVWWVRPLCRIAEAFVLSPGDPPKEIARTLGEIRSAITAGDIVCMFPEGEPSRTGNTLRFGRGVERIMEGLAAPIIPAYLDRTWGSVFSFEGGRFFLKLPKIIPHPITVLFGDPLPAGTGAFEIRQKVLELGAGAFRHRLYGQMTLPEMFFNEVRHDPFGPCVADSSGKRVNRLQAFLVSLALANKLKVRLKDSRFVGVLLPPSVGGMAVNVGLSILGKVSVNLNYTASREAMAHAVKECGMVHCLTARKFLEKLQIAPPCNAIFVEDAFKELNVLDWLGALWPLFIVPRALAHRIIFGSWNDRDNNDLATVVFTSGSTGIPKGVMLTHANVSSNLEGLYQVFHIRDNDVLLGVLPFFHSFGFTAGLWLPLVSGMGAAYHVNPLDAKVVGELVKQHKATILIATPTFLSAYTRRCEKEQFVTLRIVVVGAEKLKTSVAQAFQDKFGVPPLEGYGCTELSPVVSLNLPDYQGPEGVQKAQKRGTIGQPLPGIAVRIVDPDSSQPLRAGQQGLLLVKGANVMRGYLNQAKKTAEVISEGWYRTGDIAFLDEDGFITITDRLSRFSKIGGEMVPHVRVEDAIQTALGAAEQVCAVAAVPDEKKGEKLVVLHTVELDLAKLIDGLKSAGLPNLWIPGGEMFFKIDALPLLGSGKLDLGAIKAMALEKTGGKRL